MSLTEPTLSEKAITTFNGWPIAVRIGVGLGAVLLVVGIILFGVSRFDNWKFDRSLKKAQANVNAAMQNVNTAKAVVSNDAVNEGIAVQQFKDAVNDAVTLSNATEAAKVETNKAAANYAASVNANVPTGTTEDELNKKLSALGD